MTHSDDETLATDDCWNRIGVHGDHSCERLAQQVHCRNCDVYADAAGALMQRALPAGYREEWAAHFSRPEQTPPANDRSALVFRISGEWLALPARQAITIAEQARAHRLPHRSGNILTGVVNVRGRLYPCVSLGDLLRIAESEAPLAAHRTYPRLLVMQLGAAAFALPVHDVHGLHRYPAAEMEAPPSTAGGPLQRYVSGVLRIGDMRVGCLDAELLGARLASTLR